MNHRRRRQAEDDLRVYRNLLALLPYCIGVRTIVVAPPKPQDSVVYYRPSARRPGRHLGWN